MPDLSEMMSKRRPMAHAWPLLVVAGLGLAVAIAAWMAVAVWEERLAKAKFNDVAGDYATVLQNGLNAYLDKIRALRALYDASDGVNRREFYLFTSQILAGHLDTMRLVWCPRVGGNERGTFEREVRDSGLPDFSIKTWAPTGPVHDSEVRGEYFPILYSTVSDARTATFGTDLASEQVRSRAIRRAVDGDMMATAQDIELRNPIDGKRAGFLVFLPAYKPRLPHNNIVTRRQNVEGVIAGVFQTATVLDAILKKAVLPRSVDLFIYQANVGEDAPPLYSHIVGGARKPTATRISLAKLPHWSASLTAGDAHWDLVVVPASSSPTSYYLAWLAVALISLVFAAVLAYMWASLRHALRLETANRRILQLAQTDILTALANRRAFLKRLKMAFAASLRGAPPFAVLYLDIDDFKDVNDTLGHAMGDELLKKVVARLKQVVREEDLVARFGGDEFAILASNVSDPTEAGTLAARIDSALAEPFLIEGHKISITSSIGIALFSRDIAGPEAMMVQADLALYGAKDEGRNCYRFHSQELDRQVHERVRVADELRTALEEGDFELYYQPQVELATGRITGLEALVRWNHKTRGLLTPASFIPIAERTGAVLPLGNWIFDEACRQLKIWQSEGIAPHVLAVNVSGVQLKNTSELEREVGESLVKWNINPGEIELELTETVLMEATQRHSHTLENLRRLGIKIAIDDFGTGYSSLKYLTTYPVNRLKLAQEFVFRVTVDYRNAAVVRAAIRLAHELGLDVIAEGVETEAQMRFLIGAGCEQAQGYYFSRPVKVAQATAMLREGRVEPASAVAQRRFTPAA
jgi:diguanylate cyclase (GGDEF)-like protein